MFDSFYFLIRFIAPFLMDLQDKSSIEPNRFPLPSIISLDDFAFSTQEKEKILSVLQAWRKHRYSQFLIMALILHSGITPKEVILLEKNGLDARTHELTIYNDCHLAKRTVILPNWLFQHLVNFSKNEALIPFLFPHPSGLKQRSVRSVQKILEKFSMESGLKLNSAQIRRLISKMLRLQGNSSLEISRFLGLKHPPRWKNQEIKNQKRPELLKFPKAA